MRLALEDLHVEPDVTETSGHANLVEPAGSRGRQADEPSGEDAESAARLERPPLERPEDAVSANLASEAEKWPLAFGLIFILVSSAAFWGLVLALLRLG